MSTKTLIWWINPLNYHGLSTKTPFWWINLQLATEHNTRINNKMPKLKHLATTLLLALCAIALNAQNNEVMLNLRTGHNASFGGFAAASLEASNTISNSFKINSGIQYSSINKTAIEARPAYYKSLDWGKLSAEALLAYTNLSSINNIAAGAGLQVESKWADARLGYYYRLYGGKEGWIKEPFNLYYELSAHLIPSIENWDLNLIITNCETLELERHYQPSFIAECSYYTKANIGLSMGLGCKPSGIFHISADYYQAFLKLGVSYRW